jgi:hypothetical protein
MVTTPSPHLIAMVIATAGTTWCRSFNLLFTVLKGYY